MTRRGRILSWCIWGFSEIAVACNQLAPWAPDSLHPPPYLYSGPCGLYLMVLEESYRVVGAGTG